MATDVTTSGWEGTMIPPPKKWTPLPDVFTPMTKSHKAEWVELLISPIGEEAMKYVLQEDAEIEESYSSHKFDTYLMKKIEEGVFDKHELDNSRSFRARAMYKKKQQTLLDNYMANKTPSNYTTLTKDIAARGHLIDMPVPKKL